MLANGERREPGSVKVRVSQARQTVIVLGRDLANVQNNPQGTLELK
jgi:hypothetical protein